MTCIPKRKNSCRSRPTDNIHYKIQYPHQEDVAPISTPRRCCSVSGKIGKVCIMSAVLWVVEIEWNIYGGHNGNLSIWTIHWRKRDHLLDKKAAKSSCCMTMHSHMLLRRRSKLSARWAFYLDPRQVYPRLRKIGHFIIIYVYTYLYVFLYEKFFIGFF